MTIAPASFAPCSLYTRRNFVRPFAGGADGSGPGFRPAAALLIDEIRIGTTWNDMRAVPEPAGSI
jgi:hypothetical protein